MERFVGFVTRNETVIRLALFGAECAVIGGAYLWGASAYVKRQAAMLEATNPPGSVELAIVEDAKTHEIHLVEKDEEDEK